MFVLQNAPRSDLKVRGLDVQSVRTDSDTAKFDLTLSVVEGAGELKASLAYNTDLFDNATITRMLGHFQVLLEGVVANPDQRLSDLPILTEAEHHQLLVEWNDTKREYPKDKCIHELFEEQVERSPDAVAVVFEDQQLSYRELNQQANQVAHYLRRLGVGPETLVGVCMERSLEMIIGLLGILKAGGAYVPLDPDYPKERLVFMLKDTQARVLLTQERLVEKLPDRTVHLIRIDKHWEEITGESYENLETGATAENLAYVNYTSGSTGEPRGVEVLHRGVLRLLFGVEYVHIDKSETFLHLASTSFDASTFEIWGPLLHGAKCVLFPGTVPSPTELGQLFHQHKVSTLWLASSLFNTVIDEAPDALSGVRQLLIGGEALSVPQVRRALALLPQAQIINGYGPTESTTFTCCCSIPRELDQSINSVSIGRPISNTKVYLLDANLSPVPIGVTGELCIGGDGLARGYLNRPDLTAEKFIPNPFSSEPGARLYRTGDLARYLPDGNIEFLGRIDNQVKIRGFRIELGEIEAVLEQHAAVRDAVVLAREDVSGDKRLVGYIVPNQEPTPTPHDLRSYLKEKLPQHMVPSAFVFLDSLPLTPNGKVDRRALPAPDENRPELKEAFVKPRTSVEELLAGIWAEVLKLEKVGIHDNFFDLGGHSLKATQVMSRVREALRVDLPLRVMFEAPTIAELASIVEQSMSQSYELEELVRNLAEVESLPEVEIERQLAKKNKAEAK
jgi:aspartate racemase